MQFLKHQSAVGKTNFLFQFGETPDATSVQDQMRSVGLDPNKSLEAYAQELNHGDLNGQTMVLDGIQYIQGKPTSLASPQHLAERMGVATAFAQESAAVQQDIVGHSNEAAAQVAAWRMDINSPEMLEAGGIRFGQGRAEYIDGAPSATSAPTPAATDTRKNAPTFAEAGSANVEALNENVTQAAEDLVKESAGLEATYNMMAKADDIKEFARLIAENRGENKDANQDKYIAAIKEVGITDEMIGANNTNVIINWRKPFHLIVEKFTEMPNINEISKLNHRVETGSVAGDQTLQEHYEKYAKMDAAEEVVENAAAQKVVDHFLKVMTDDGKAARKALFNMDERGLVRSVPVLGKALESAFGWGRDHKEYKALKREIEDTVTMINNPDVSVQEKADRAQSIINKLEAERQEDISEGRDVTRQTAAVNMMSRGAQVIETANERANGTFRYVDGQGTTRTVNIPGQFNVISEGKESEHWRDCTEQEKAQVMLNRFPNGYTAEMNKFKIATLDQPLVKVKPSAIAGIGFHGNAEVAAQMVADGRATDEWDAYKKQTPDTAYIIKDIKERYSGSEYTPKSIRASYPNGTRGMDDNAVKEFAKGKEAELVNKYEANRGKSAAQLYASSLAEEGIYMNDQEMASSFASKQEVKLSQIAETFKKNKDSLANNPEGWDNVSESDVIYEMPAPVSPVQIVNIQNLDGSYSRASVQISYKVYMREGCVNPLIVIDPANCTVHVEEKTATVTEQATKTVTDTAPGEQVPTLAVDKVIVGGDFNLMPIIIVGASTIAGFTAGGKTPFTPVDKVPFVPV